MEELNLHSLSFRLSLTAEPSFEKTHMLPARNMYVDSTHPIYRGFQLPRRLQEPTAVWAWLIHKQETTTSHLSKGVEPEVQATSLEETLHPVSTEWETLLKAGSLYQEKVNSISIQSRWVRCCLLATRQCWFKGTTSARKKTKRGSRVSRIWRTWLILKLRL